MGETLSGKVALITGSAKGLGKMTAIYLAQQGCSIAINYVHSEREARELASQLAELKVSSTVIQADITDFHAAKQMVKQVEDELGEVDILINNAGPFVRERKTFTEYTTEEIQYLIQGNLTGALQLDHLVLPGMRRKRWGRIVHFGFGRAGESRGWPHRAVYAAAKVGLVSFTKTLAVEEAEHGITVNMICPGDIRGDNKEKWIDQVRGEVDEESPIGRPGTGEDVARIIAFLCDQHSDYITGNILDVSGGLDPIRNFPMK